MNDEGRLALGLPDTHAGFLEKKGKLKNGTWKRRYFALRGHHLLCFQDAEPDRPVLASIDVVKVEVCGPVRNISGLSLVLTNLSHAQELTDTDSIFNLKVLEGSIKLRAPDAAARRLWEQHLHDAQKSWLGQSRQRRSEERVRQVLESHAEATKLRRVLGSSDEATAPVPAAASEEVTCHRTVSIDDGATSISPNNRFAPPEEECASSNEAVADASDASRDLSGPRKYRVNTAGNDMINMLASAGYAASVAHTVATQPTKEGVAARSRATLSRSHTYDDASSRAGSLVRSMSHGDGRRPRRRSHASMALQADVLSWEWGEPEAERWIVDCLGLEARPALFSDLWAWLHDGTVLCQLANKLKPGALRGKKVHHDTKLPFKMLENISTFLTVCRDEFGVESRSLFESLDLFDRKGTQQVLYCLNALKRRALQQGPSGKNGSSHGLTGSGRSRTASATAPPPSNRGLSDEGSPDDSTSGSKGGGSLPSMFKRRSGSENVDVDPTYVPTHQTAAASQNQSGDDSIISDGYATVIAEHDANDKDELTVFIGDVVSVKLSRGGWCFAEGNEGWVLVQKGGEQGLVPASCLKAGTSKDSYFKAGGGRGSSALDNELKAKAAAKYDPIAEALAQHWIEQVTGHVFRKQFAEELKDGVVLCRLINEIKPSSVPKIYEGPKAYQQMDNISNFLKAIKKLGVLSRDTFETTDLFEMRDLNLVVQCLFALSKTLVKAVPDFSGPFLTGHDAGFNEAVMSNLKVIIAVSEHRDRHRHYQQRSQDDLSDDAQAGGTEDDVLSEAVEYRLAMLGLRDSQVAGANVHGVDRSTLEPSFLVVWSSSTKSTLAMETNERRLVQLLAAKKKRYEMVYIDVSPERKVELALICKNQDVELPALTFGSDYHGPFERIQELEDDGKFDELIAPAPDGEGYWALPEAWGVQSSMLEGGGMQIINEVPAL